MSDALARFVEKGGLAGSFVHQVAVAPAEGFAALLREHGLMRIVVAAGVAEAAPWLDAAVTAAGAQSRRVTSRADILWAEAGVSVATLAIAETGSVLPYAPTRLDRLVSMLPATHVVLVREQVLVPRLEDGAAHLRREARAARYLSFVTGPSRTGDIEMVLTVGVHGPSALHLFVLCDAPQVPSEAPA